MCNNFLPIKVIFPTTLTATTTKSQFLTLSKTLSQTETLLAPRNSVTNSAVNPDVLYLSQNASLRSDASNGLLSTGFVPLASCKVWGRSDIFILGSIATALSVLAKSRLTPL